MSILREKIGMHAILKVNTANYISLERLINVDFGKNMNCQFLQFDLQEKTANNCENDHVSFN